MTNESFFALAITAMIAMFFGFVVAFSGYRFFLVLLPIFGFFYGFGLGAHSIQALFGQAFLATVTAGGWSASSSRWCSRSCRTCSICSASRLIAGALGYSLGTGLIMAFGIDFGFLAWLVGIVVGVVFAVGAIALNIQKWVIVIATALLGAGVIVGTFLFLFGEQTGSQIARTRCATCCRPRRSGCSYTSSWHGFGIAAQYATTRTMEIEAYDRFAEIDASPAPAGSPVRRSHSALDRALHQPELDGAHRRLRAIADAQLGEDVLRRAP